MCTCFIIIIVLCRQACSSEAMMFRVARKYDITTDSIVFANNQPFSADSYNKAGLGDAIENQLSFSRFMYKMKVDNAEYALLTAIVIFSSNYTRIPPIDTLKKKIF